MSCYSSLIDRDSDGSDICNGQYTTNCNAQGQQCEYSAMWTVKGDYIQFNISARVTAQSWIAIGFSDNRLMVRLWMLL